MKRLRALRSLHMNYTRRGVVQWLKGRHRATGLRGWQMILREPERVELEQHAIADGAYV